jgi:hypothetical protein
MAQLTIAAIVVAAVTGLAFLAARLAANRQHVRELQAAKSVSPACLV